MPLLSRYKKKTFHFLINTFENNLDNGDKIIFANTHAFLKQNAKFKKSSEIDLEVSRFQKFKFLYHIFRPIVHI